MKGDNYKQYFCSPNLMGPNSIRILDELLEDYPLRLTKQQKIIDLGCGTGMTSLFIANETGATVYATDLWIAEEDNRRRFAEWGMDNQIVPIHADATDLHFDKEMFDALISIDSYHYFAGREGFFEQKILPYIKKGGIVLIGIPGIKDIYTGRSEELLTDWLGDEAYMFRSMSSWKNIIGNCDEIEMVKTWEMNCFETAWQEWFAAEPQNASYDLSFYERIIKPYTTFVGIMVKKKS